MNIGLIAMSGIRAVDSELNKLGLTLPGFVERKKVITALPSLSLLTLAGMTPKNIDLEYIEVSNKSFSNILKQDFDMVAISSYSARIKEAYQLADKYRELGIKVVMGGLHVSAMPKEALEHADSIVIGEGESSWPKLLKDFKNRKLQRVYDSRNTNFDLANSPIPRFELLDPKKYNRITIQTQRGCPFRCDFCAASIRISPTYKVKPIAKVIEEIQRIKEIWPNPFIEFADDNTFVNKSHSKKLLRAVQKENIRWFTETDLSVSEDEELLGLMRDSGCAQVLIGFESTTLSGLYGIEQKENWKAKNMGSFKRAIDRIQQKGVTVNGCFILGLDGTGPESFDSVWRFVQESGLYEVQITLLTPFPGTPLYERLKKEDRIIQDGAWELCTLFDVNFIPEQMTVKELEVGFRCLTEKLYSEDSILERKRIFRRILKGFSKRDIKKSISSLLQS